MACAVAAFGDSCLWVRLRMERPIEQAPDRTRSQVQTSAGQRLRDSDLPHERTEHLEPLHDLRNEVRELVDRLAHPNQCFRSLLVNAPDPSRNSLGRRDQSLRSLLDIPPASGPELEDLEALGWGTVGSLSRWNAGQTSGYEAQLALYEAELCLKAFELGGTTPSTDVAERDASERDDLQNGGLDEVRPTVRQSDFLRIACHRVFSFAWVPTASLSSRALATQWDIRCGIETSRPRLFVLGLRPPAAWRAERASPAKGPMFA
jgi:hypothetical protein